MSAVESRFTDFLFGTGTTAAPEPPPPRISTGPATIGLRLKTTVNTQSQHSKSIILSARDFVDAALSIASAVSVVQSGGLGAVSGATVSMPIAMSMLPPFVPLADRVEGMHLLANVVDHDAGAQAQNPAQGQNVFISESYMDSIIQCFFGVSSLETFYSCVSSLLGFPTPKTRRDRAMVRNAILMHVSLLTYSFSFALVDPIVVPNLVTEFAKKSGNPSAAFEFGKLQSVFAVSQIASSLVVGAVVDKYDPRAGMALTLLVGSVGSYSLVALSNSMTMLYLSKIPGIFMASALVSQAGITKYWNQMSNKGASNNEDESETGSSISSSASALGRLFLEYRLGAAIGTTVGGALIGVLGNHGVAGFAGVVSVATVGLTFFGLERLDADSTATSSSNPNEPGTPRSGMKSSPALSSPRNLNSPRAVSSTHVNEQEEEDESLLSGILGIFRMLGSNKTLQLVTVATTFASTGRALFQTTFPFIAKQDYGLNDSGLGWVLGLGMGAGLVANAFLIEPATRFFGGDRKQVIFWSMLVSGGCLVGYGVLPMILNSWTMCKLTGLYAITLPFQIGGALAETIMVSLAADSVESQSDEGATGTSSAPKCSDGSKKQKTGSAVSVLHSTLAATELVGPLVGTKIYELYGAAAVGTLGSGLMAGGAGAMLM